MSCYVTSACLLAHRDSERQFLLFRDCSLSSEDRYVHERENQIDVVYKYLAFFALDVTELVLSDQPGASALG